MGPEGGERFGKAAVLRLLERDRLGRQGLDTGDDAGDRVVDGKEAHAGFARQRPERPPRFSMSRIAPITMPRSTAFAMS